MGQHIRHEDGQTTAAGGQISDAIFWCRESGIPDSKIIEALIGELYGMSYELQRHVKDEEL